MTSLIMIYYFIVNGHFYPTFTVKQKRKKEREKKKNTRKKKKKKTVMVAMWKEVF